MTFKKLTGKLHLWLGLISGILVLFLGITGCILAFEREIENVTQPYRFTKVEQSPLLRPSELKKIADQELPGKAAHSIGYEPGKSATAVYYGDKPEAYYYIVFLNPYTGKVLEVKNMSDDFFRIIIMGHFYLWLPPHIGQPILASATLVFVLLMITGIILWWPRHKAALKQRFTIKWHARWRRRNYDLHNVFGFYVTWVAIFLALTGLVMGFQWFSNSVYWIASGGRQEVAYQEIYSDSIRIMNKASNIPAMDKLWYKTMKENPGYKGSIEIHPPENAKSVIEVAMNPNTGTFWQYTYLFYDQYTLKEKEVKHRYGKLQNASIADKIMRMNYDIHVGAIGGIAGKIIAFLASLIAASMPITGFLIWLGRKKKSCKKLNL
ncbi:putative iron-regulated membrane protein [Arcticibacter svalbardensis MN12-7]|uniref:Putative iron-regulated membrane protein n=1 Tax=Arcticibacter svalbardensis MN12-7 TaxID=1150600 RepID=R9GWW7_9SPHI|nr:PepSY-associated TM helix domain-containing protein [Arcticibacter svalbardensis]EOR96015.1 putative iron-regulated membrane protein [Arcticibacter svalbardensis MN12-7]